MRISIFVVPLQNVFVPLQNGVVDPRLWEAIVGPSLLHTRTPAIRFGSILSFQTQQQQQRTLSFRQPPSLQPAGAYALRSPFSTHQEPTPFRCSSQMAPVAPLPFALPGGDIQVRFSLLLLIIQCTSLTLAFTFRFDFEFSKLCLNFWLPSSHFNFS